MFTHQALNLSQALFWILERKQGLKQEALSWETFTPARVGDAQPVNEQIRDMSGDGVRQGKIEGQGKWKGDVGDAAVNEGLPREDFSNK